MFPFHNALQTFTFFVTPEYVKWLDEDNGFLQHALDHIFGDWSATDQKVSNLSLPEGYQKSIESRVAVVDRIPFPGGGSSGYPGISFVASAWSRHYLKDGLSRRSVDGKTKSTVPLISVKLPSRNEHGEVNITRVLLQPANTLFVNGLPYTMFADRWVGNSEAESGPKFSRKSARESIDQITFNHTFENSSLTLPMQKLTQRREISTCMGNVISKLVQNPDSEATSASRELEESVSTFLKTEDATNGTLAVFALIIPKPRAEIESIQAPVISPELLGYDQSRTVENGAVGNHEALDPIRLALSQGAHLHRVTSGGGGWGKKQGLLSLEPALGFGGEESEDTSSWIPEASERDSEESRPFWSQSAVPVIAQPGDMVEFYGVFWSKGAEQTLTRRESLLTASNAPNTKWWHGRAWAEADISNIVFGVTAPQDSNVASTLSTLGEELISVPHHFGMLSEHGMALSTVDFEIDKDATTAHAVHREYETKRTRIDVPHTVFTYSVRNRFATPPNMEKTVKIRWRKVKGDLSDENAPVYHYAYGGAGPVDPGFRYAYAGPGPVGPVFHYAYAGSAPEGPVFRYAYTGSAPGGPASQANQKEPDAPVQSEPRKWKDLERLSAMRLAAQMNRTFLPTINVGPDPPSRKASARQSERDERRRMKRATKVDVPVTKYPAPFPIRKHNAGH